MTGTHVTISLSPRSARVAAMLAPHPWEASGPDAVTFTRSPSGRVVTAIIPRAYAPRLLAQMEAARDFRACAAVRAALAA